MEEIPVSLMSAAVLNLWYVKDLISRADARSILNMSPKDWNTQVKVASGTELSSYQGPSCGSRREDLKKRSSTARAHV